jgi:WD40 repeat protein
VNLDGPVRVADTAGSGTATVTLSFDAWKGAKVAPTTHAVPVLPAKAGAKAEAVAGNLVATLVHPDRRASVWSVQFSDDGKRLAAVGYPSGVVQVFDVASRKELRRIETPSGYRGSADYALLTPDWKTLYVPVEKREVKPIEKDGKRLYRIEHSGTIRVWDVTTGEERAPLRPPEGSAPVFAKLSPDGGTLTCVERPSYDSDDRNPKDVTVAWDLKTGKRRVIAEGFASSAFSPDGQTLALQSTDRVAKKSTLRLLDAATFKELARLDCPDKDRNFLLDGFSPDGRVIAVSLGGKKGVPREVWFRDAKTLDDRGKFTGDGEPDRYGWGEGRFTPDGKSYAVLGVPGKVVVWDVAGQKAARTFEIEAFGWFSAVSPDGKTLAVAWMPKLDPELEGVRDPDPRDLPQPRVALFDLAGTAPPRTLVAPPGYTGGLAFSPDGKTLAFGSSGGVRLFDLSK